MNLRKFNFDWPTRRWNGASRRLLIVWLLIAVPAGVLAEDSGGNDAEVDTLASASEILKRDLPSAPAELDKLIRRGGVSFHTGGEKATTSSYDAETEFKVLLDYRTRCRWRLFTRGGRRRISVAVRFGKVSVTMRHRVWLREAIDADDFWRSALVRHEFDHVRLTLALASEQEFQRRLGSRSNIQQDVAPQIEVTERWVQALIDETVQNEFQKVMDLIDIRYQQLDRETGHGRRPLGEESTLRPWLRGG